MIVSGNQPLGLTWSSYEQNDVGIKLNIFDGNERSSSLLGAQLVNGGSTLISQSPCLNYLISANSSWIAELTNFEVYDLSARSKTIFSLGCKEGKIYDIAFNPKLNLVALMSLRSKTAYHIYKISSFELLQKRGFCNTQATHITSIDFDLSGEKIVTASYNGVFAVESTINNDTCEFLKETDALITGIHRCRWNPIRDLVAISFGISKVNFLDTIKKEFHFQTHLEHHKNRVTSIQWNPEGSILATSSWDRTICLIDSRSREIIRRFSEADNGEIVRGIRWSPDGNLLGIATANEKVAVRDLKADGKIVYSESFPCDGGMSSIEFLRQP